MGALASRGLNVDPCCPRCGVEREDIGHMVLHCSESQMWNLRNMWVFETKRVEPTMAYTRTVALLGEYEAANARDAEPAPTPVSNQHWQAPYAGHYKLNTDASVIATKVGLGVLVRDSMGDVLMSAWMRGEEAIPVLQAEAEALRFGLQYAYDAGFRSLEVESDNQALVKLVQAHEHSRMHMHVIVEDIVTLPNAFEFCSFIFLSRNCNKVAHSIANISLTMEEVKVWMEECPTETLPFVLVDKAMIE
ncbi:uncharacterized protein [Spinacia oleracea]|uniref:RNase H type-1 domain-containing protein n=1 Tax=Spinacia oleracea TaxID=3562 RepID=A0ABM3R9J0_SPIOL|nr:uncharacterized protein LOC110784687 [Spinacia oleracea]